MTYSPPTSHAKKQLYYFLSSLYNGLNYSWGLIQIDSISKNHHQKRKGEREGEGGREKERKVYMALIQTYLL